MTEDERYNILLEKYKQDMASGEWKKKTYNEFLDIVSNKPEKINHKKHNCPYCGSKKTKIELGSQTLVGYLGKKDNVNHYWDNGHCEGCLKEWTVEYVGKNTWLTSNQKILRGIPSCFENYTYSCNKCNGEVRRSHYNKGTRDIAKSLITIIGDDKQYDTYFRCEKCGQEAKSFNDYFYDFNPHKPRKPFPAHKWAVFEEIGQVVYNKDIKSIDFGEK